MAKQYTGVEPAFGESTDYSDWNRRQALAGMYPIPRSAMPRMVAPPMVVPARNPRIFDLAIGDRRFVGPAPDGRMPMRQIVLPGEALSPDQTINRIASMRTAPPPVFTQSPMAPVRNPAFNTTPRVPIALPSGETTMDFLRRHNLNPSQKSEIKRAHVNDQRAIDQALASQREQELALAKANAPLAVAGVNATSRETVGAGHDAASIAVADKRAAASIYGSDNRYAAAVAGQKSHAKVARDIIAAQGQRLGVSLAATAQENEKQADARMAQIEAQIAGTADQGEQNRLNALLIEEYKAKVAAAPVNTIKSEPGLDPNKHLVTETKVSRDLSGVATAGGDTNSNGIPDIAKADEDAALWLKSDAGKGNPIQSGHIKAALQAKYPGIKF